MHTRYSCALPLEASHPCPPNRRGAIGVWCVAHRVKYIFSTFGLTYFRSHVFCVWVEGHVGWNAPGECIFAAGKRLAEKLLSVHGLVLDWMEVLFLLFLLCVLQLPLVCHDARLTFFVYCLFSKG